MCVCVCVCLAKKMDKYHHDSLFIYAPHSHAQKFAHRSIFSLSSHATHREMTIERERGRHTHTEQ